MTAPSTVDDLVLALHVAFVDADDVRTTRRAIVEVDDGMGTLDLPTGPRGQQGFPGMSIETTYIADGYLYLVRSDGAVLQAGLANQPGPRGLPGARGEQGLQGDQGPPGVVTQARFDELVDELTALRRRVQDLEDGTPPAPGSGTTTTYPGTTTYPSSSTSPNGA